MSSNRKVINVFPEGARGEQFRRRANLIKEIAIGASLKQLEDPKTLAIAGGIGLWQGLKYKGNLNLGVKSGVATLAVMLGVNIVNNLIADSEEIKNA